MSRWLLAVCLWFAAACGAQTISHGRFQDLAIYRPAGVARHVVLLLSGTDGWNARLATTAQRLAAEGALVAGIDTPALFADLERDGADCVSPDGDLENLSHFLQAYYRLPFYRAPILVGYSSGAAFAYAMIAQAPAATFAGGVSLAFDPHLTLKAPLCRGGHLQFTERRDGHGVNLLPAAKLDAPWIVLQSPQGDVALEDAVRRLAALSEPLLAPRELSGLPVVEVAAKDAGSDVLAVLLSGDGGWAGIDKQLAATLAAHGIPVAGLDSLRYFWSARTPQSTADDVDRILRYYLAKWHKRQVMLIGYSRGADTVPFVLNRLPAPTRAHVRLAAMLGPGLSAQFEFHLSSWLRDDQSGLPIRPEAERVSGPRVLCIYGEDETDTLCPTLSKGNVQIVKLPGGHHFDGDYARLAKLLIERLTTP